MSFIGKWIGSLTGAQAQADAASQAAQTQGTAAQAGIDEQKRQFDAYQQMLQPFVTAGTGALAGQQNLIGLGGAPAQQDAIDSIQSSPQFAALQQQGQNAILQNASATGGLRGGNVQGALAQFNPSLLSGLIDQQYQRLGGLTQAGQASAAGTGAAGLQSGSNIAQLLQQQGAATAGGQLAQGSVGASGLNTVAGLGGLFAGAGGIPGIKKLF
jgi:hypothetical protein